MNQGLVLDMVLLDFSKALDGLSHSVLLKKLQCLGCFHPTIVLNIKFSEC